MVKHVMVLVPHQDDEVCLMGEYLERHLYKDDVLIKLVYLTNGDYITAATTRKAEALEAVQLFGILEKDVTFLGYPDTPFESDNPYTDNRLKAITLSIEQVILRFTPYIIFCTDSDFHPDHRALSLCFNRAMDSILKKAEGYRPIVFKGFSYSTAFYGKKDYSRINNPPATIPTPERLDNPSLNWNARVRLKNPGAVNHVPLWNNKIYQALLKHKSQCGLQYYQSIINGDQVFFKERTDNLLFSSSISELKVSSGIKQYLYDFSTGSLYHIMDCGNTDAPYNCIWKPDKHDLSPTISICFKHPQTVAYISIHGNPNLHKQMVAGEVVINRNQTIPFQLLNEYGKETIVHIHNQEVYSIYITLQQPCSGIGELGVYKNDDNTSLFLPIMPLVSKSNYFHEKLINYLEWLYIRISWVNFRLHRKINFLIKRIRKV